MSLSVIQRILFGFSILLLLLLMIAASGFVGINKIEDRLNIVTGKVATISSTSNALKDDLSLANAAVLQYLLSKKPDSLESLSERFSLHKQEFSEVSNQLSVQLQDLPEMNQALGNINAEVEHFFGYTDIAFSNHKKMLELQAVVPDEKLDLKDAINFTSEDLGMLETDGDTSEVQFAASYMQSQIQSLQVTVNDYFDVRSLEKMQAFRDEMASIITSLKDKESYLKDDNINDLVNEIEMGVVSDEGVVAKQYESARLVQESERLAKQLSDSMEVVNTSVQELLSATTQMGGEAKAEASAAATLSTLIIGIVLVVSIVIAVLVALWVSRSIRLPLKEVMTVLGKISDGDFTQRSNVQTKDEFGELSNWVNGLVAKLQSVMAEIDQVSNNVAESAVSNVRLAANSKRLMKAQNDKTTEVASSMSEMVSAVDQVAKSSEVILHQIQSVDQRANQNRALMDSNIQKMELLLAKIEESTEVVNQLDEHSKNIDRILDVIQAIAEQTNLLALNAAIEAARAGEQGRGFSVVADEVRTLATRTHSSTEEIQRVIVQLQQGVTKTVGSMEESRKSANASVEEARTVGLSLAELQSSMAEIRDLSTQIAAAAEEQSAVSQEVKLNVLEISEMSEQAALGSDQSESDSEGLSKLASHQKHLLSQFKIV
ncbi:methyl-accepting chemotaxis protein [Marinomonas primoryensis]|jgi:methyl-accepting chemotaxis protein|uniref:Methyl-accepting chemotaxis protein n=1 Tax=Marinomonas primoryensis TaxID=178399 RepID=A0A859CXF7_9GAMM|nr:methyl-accepting chemotaxis protein [Marinomonas primoryensis]QKK79180.1 methyl-accepting chemotaxis protein [Marinomonas primoryensis]|tara:strand:+ start:350 stop:2326 length:1977 start_codon:yes stop_codon:yes gene_type:complete